MGWNQNNYDEVTKALEATLDEQPAKGKLNRIASFDLVGLAQFFERMAKTAPESLPEAPWERNTKGSSKCTCGECDGAGWIYVEGKGVKPCNARSNRISREADEAKSDVGKLDLREIFPERG
ncbi:MAG TPA: hypothetical protein VF131_14280 [Blastocatellia bacterium]|nr:hypothetical protein [Blastocatellia bacterium]